MKNFLTIKTLFAVSVIVHHVAVASQIDLLSFFSADGYSIRAEKEQELRAITESDEDSILRAGASAILASVYLQKDDASNCYSNVHAFADFAITHCADQTAWPVIYAKFAIIVSHSTGYLPEYAGQTNRIPSLMADINREKWDSVDNPIYMHLIRDYQMNHAELLKILRQLLVQAYCDHTIGAFDSAHAVIANVENVEEKKELEQQVSSFIKTQMPNAERPVTPTEESTTESPPSKTPLPHLSSSLLPSLAAALALCAGAALWLALRKK